MKLSFLAPSTRQPIGGNAMIYEFATAMAQRGHEVRLYHHELWGGDALSELSEIGWYEFRAEIDHHFAGPDGFDLATIEPADIFFGYAPEIEENPHWGLPVCWIQGYRMYPGAEEDKNFRKPCPKICIARWLVDVAIDHGVDPSELVHISNAMNHEHHRLTRPFEDRPPRVLFCYNPHPMKGAALAIEVLEELHRRRPDVEIVGFGHTPPATAFPDGFVFHHEPDQEMLVDRLYNGSRIFLWTSEVEGFGLPALESMACGAALVTTDNGGSRDYAIHGETALVAPYGDAAALLAHVEGLLDDEPRRLRIARAGQAKAATFSWEEAGRKLEEFLERYRADPQGHGRPA